MYKSNGVLSNKIQILHIDSIVTFLESVNKVWYKWPEGLILTLQCGTARTHVILCGKPMFGCGLKLGGGWLIKVERLGCLPMLLGPPGPWFPWGPWPMGGPPIFLAPCCMPDLSCRPNGCPPPGIIGGGPAFMSRNPSGLFSLWAPSGPLSLSILGPSLWNPFLFIWGFTMQKPAWSMASPRDWPLMYTLP